MDEHSVIVQYYEYIHHQIVTGVLIPKKPPSNNMSKFGV